MANGQWLKAKKTESNSSFFVKEYTLVCRQFSIVFGVLFLAKTTGRCNRYPTIIAGAIPLASIVTILSIFSQAKRLTNSSAIAFIIIGSIWWLIKPSTLRIPPSRHLPSRIILSLRSFIILLKNRPKVVKFPISAKQFFKLANRLLYL